MTKLGCCEPKIWRLRTCSKLYSSQIWNYDTKLEWIVAYSCERASFSSRSCVVGQSRGLPAFATVEGKHPNACSVQHWQYWRDYFGLRVGPSCMASSNTIVTTWNHFWILRSCECAKSCSGNLSNSYSFQLLVFHFLRDSAAFPLLSIQFVACSFWSRLVFFALHFNDGQGVASSNSGRWR